MATNSEETGVSVFDASLTSTPIRTLTITTPIDGELTDVQMQVVGIADAEGRPVMGGVDEHWRHEVLAELRAIRMGIEHLVGGGLRE